MQNAFQGFTFVDESTMEERFGGRDGQYDERVDDNYLSRSRTKEHRMSGVQKTGDDGFFFEE
jgi:protein-serine/threonine kinase